MDIHQLKRELHAALVNTNSCNDPTAAFVEHLPDAANIGVIPKGHRLFCVNRNALEEITPWSDIVSALPEVLHDHVPKAKIAPNSVFIIDHEQRVYFSVASSLADTYRDKVLARAKGDLSSRDTSKRLSAAACVIGIIGPRIAGMLGDHPTLTALMDMAALINANVRRGAEPGKGLMGIPDALRIPLIAANASGTLASELKQASRADREDCKRALQAMKTALMGMQK